MSRVLNDIYKIQKAIREKTLVIFIGAGVSANSNVPTWGDLITKISKELNLQREIQQNEYLKIAQYYYNKSPKTFFENIKNFLDGEWKPNIITEYLFKELAPQYFVTTNYDDILEQTANKLSMPYLLIAQDEDIPKIGKNNAIIKMHGDFKHRNIVLKEDDYIKYQENYRLMEVYIKSLFATNTILFVGFSADDPNVNQIYSWVNNILQSNQREAYLLQVEDFYSDYKLKKQYFDKKGIHIINYNELKEKIESYIKEKNIAKDLNTIKNTKGQQLYKLLHFIKNTKPNILEHCYQKLLPTKYLNYLSEENISKILNPYWFCYSGILSTSHDKNMGKLIKLLKKKTEKARNTQVLLSHLGIKKLQEEEWQEKRKVIKNEINITTKKERSFLLLDLINEFNYIEAEKFLGDIYNENLLNAYIDKNINSVNVFEKVYILLKLQKYEIAFNLLEKISYKAKDKKNYFIFLISEFNKKVVFNYYYNDKYYQSSAAEKEALNKIQNDYWAINISDLMKKFLSDEELNVIEDKLNFKFIENLDKKILKDTAEESYTKLCLKDVYNTYIKNYIFIENYQEFQKLCMHSISLELKTFNIQEDTMSLYFAESPNKNKYDFLDLLFIIKYAKTSDLNNLIFRNKIKELPLKNEIEKNKLLSAYNNLINSIIHFDLCEKNRSLCIKYLEYLHKFFIVFKVLPLSKNDIENIITNYLKLIEKYKWYVNYYNTPDLLFYLLNFIITNYNKTYSNTNLNSRILTNFLTYIVNNSSMIKDSENDKHQVLRFVSEISSIIRKIDPKFKNSFFTIVNKDIFSIQLYSFIYKISDKKTKEKIKKLILNQLEADFNHELYQYACLENIIKSDVRYEQKLVQEIENRIIKYNELKITKPKTCNGLTNNPLGLDEIHDILRTIANLLNFEKINDTTLFEQYKEHKDFVTYNYFLFAIDMKTFDYNKFQLNYLRYLTKRKKKQLKRIINSDLKKKELIKEKFISQISLENDFNNYIRDISLNILYEEPIIEQ